MRGRYNFPKTPQYPLRGNRPKEREVRIAIKSVLGDDDGFVDAIFEN